VAYRSWKPPPILLSRSWAIQRARNDDSISPRRLTLGSITGVLIGTLFIFSGLELTSPQIDSLKARHLYDAYLRSETLRVVKPYLVLGAISVFWALLILRTKFPAIQSDREASKEDHGTFRDLLHYPRFLLAVAAQFMYVGAQVGTWSYFIQYVQESTHQPEKVAGYFLTGTLAAFGSGRFISAYLMRFIAPSKLLGTYAVVNVALVSVGVLMPGWIGLWAVFLTSFFMSVMFPTIFASGLKGLGPNTKIGSSLLVMAIVGGAVLTPVMGLIAESCQNIALAYLVPLVAYAFVAAYAFFGANLRRPETVGQNEATSDGSCISLRNSAELKR
jgi:FHS family L-fucose permease-like MFS transporter